MHLFRLDSAFIDWTCTAEMTLSLQVDLVLSDAADTSEP